MISRAILSKSLAIVANKSEAFAAYWGKVAYPFDSLEESSKSAGITSRSGDLWRIDSKNTPEIGGRGHASILGNFPSASYCRREGGSIGISASRQLPTFAYP
jgi:hypothetical protein